MKESKIKIFLNKHGRKVVTVASVAAICLLVVFAVIGVNYAFGRHNEPDATITFATDPVEAPVEPIETTVPLTTAPATTPAPTEPPAPPEPEVDPEELEMLAIVIFQEAGGDECCDECRRRVADVVLNRVESPYAYYPDDIYSVLTQKYQYGRLYWTGIVWPERASHASEQYAVERAYRIAEEVLLGKHSDVYGTGMCNQAEYSVFNKYWNGGEYIHHCSDLYFFKSE